MHPLASNMTIILLGSLTLGLSVVGLIWAVFYSSDNKSDQQEPNRKDEQTMYINKYTLPETVYEKCKGAYPGLSEGEFRIGVAALKQYFIACVKADGRYVAMPSKFADEIWHQFILHTREYNNFCENAFGRFLHHEPDKKDGAAIKREQGLIRAWDLCLGHEGVKGDGIPLLFRADYLLSKTREVQNATLISRSDINDMRGRYSSNAGTSIRDRHSSNAGESSSNCDYSSALIVGALLMSSSGDSHSTNQHSTHSASDSSSSSHSCGSSCGSSCGGGD